MFMNSQTDDKLFVAVRIDLEQDYFRGNII
jgi:hypothetical protein